MKKFFKSDRGDIHFGIVMIQDFVPAEMNDAEEALSNLGNRKLWRCTVCNDLYIGEVPPKQCPTCSAADAYIEINETEFKEMIK